MPAIDDVLAVTTAVLVIAAWVVPPVRYLLSFRRKARDSLVVVGRAIGMFVLAGILSAAALVFAFLTLAFTQRAAWGWFGLAAIAAYWIPLGTAAAVSRLIWSCRQRSGKSG